MPITLKDLFGISQNLVDTEKHNSGLRSHQAIADQHAQTEAEHRKNEMAMQEKRLAEDANRRELDRTLKGQEMAMMDKYHTGQLSHLERSDRQNTLEALLKGQGTSKPLSAEQEKSQLLSNESLDSANRLSKLQAENPKTAKFIAATEGVPLVGGALGGLAAFFNKNADAIKAERDRLTQNMGYLKSGAAQSEKELARLRAGLPNGAGDTAYQQEKLNTFTKPLRDIQDLHAGRGQSQGPAIGQEDAINFVMNGKQLPPMQAQQPRSVSPQVAQQPSGPGLVSDSAANAGSKPIMTPEQRALLQQYRAEKAKRGGI